MRALLLVSTLLARADARGVNWYLSSSNTVGNAALLAAHGDALTGAYLCCNFVSFAANGSFSTRFTAAESSAQIAVFTSQNVDEVWAVGGVDEAAIHSGAWVAGLAAAVRTSEALLADGLMGLIIDYEPADNYTQAHADAYGNFLGALASAIAPLRVGMDIASWGILEFAFWPQYVGRGVSRFTSMTPTYDAKNVTFDREFVKQALAFFPPGSYAAGIGTVLAPGQPPCGGGDYLWTNATFSPFVNFLGDSQVEFIDVWRCDIDAKYDNGRPDLTAPFFLDALAHFLAPAPEAGAALGVADMTASPSSTLLRPGVTNLTLSLATTAPTDCRWDTADVPFATMGNNFDGAGTTAHATMLTGLSGGLRVVSVYVQCAAFAAGAPLVLSYRSVPDSGNAPFPRLGNLWGSGNFRGHGEGLSYAAARSSLWLGSSWSADEISQLRAYNPYTIVLTSVNACEVNDQDLPDSFYLLNITQPPSTRGRLQSWPGAWRLDLTNPVVQSWQAQLMYCLVVFGGSGYGPTPGCANATVPPLIFDGLFVDNVFEDDGASVNSRDIFGNPFTPIDRATGLPMTNFNEKWRAGMVSMINQFRALMPDALLSGHAMDVEDENITGAFNAISIGFTTPLVIEGYETFSSGFSNYDAWMTKPSRDPKITMVESAVRLMFGYGYGFDRDLETLVSYNCSNSDSVAGAPVPGNGDACYPTAPQPAGFMLPETFMFARSEYKYMRFGLAFTLMRDGYFCHEVGDSWHGQDWLYDETLFSLGRALGNASSANVTSPAPTPAPPAIPLTTEWFLYVRSPATSNASWAFDATVIPFADAPPSVRVDVVNTAPSSDGIDLSQVIAGLKPAGGYALSFWARASLATPITLNARKDGGDWHNFGLDQPVMLTTAWVLVNVSFTSSSDGSAGRLSWFAGRAAPGTSIWINSPALTGIVIAPQVLTREFQCGVVVLNGDAGAPNATVALSGGLSRLAGEQAPRWQYFVDDASPSAFSVLTGDWVVADFVSGYDRAQATQEQVRPPAGYYHAWGTGAHVAAAGGSARFDLGVPAAGAYDVSLWWPAAVPARAGWAQAMTATIIPGGAAVALNLTRDGGDVFFRVATGAQLAPGAALELACVAGGGACVADAVLLESAARWNDGSDIGGSVTLAAMDAIVLRRTPTPPGC